MRQHVCVIVFVVLWLLVIAFSIHQVWLFCNNTRRQIAALLPGSLEDGWFGSTRDAGDFETRFWKAEATSLLLLASLHLAFSVLISRYASHFRLPPRTLSTGVDVLLLGAHFGARPLLFFIAICVAIVLPRYYFGKRYMAWAAVCALLCYRYEATFQGWHENELYRIESSAAYVVLRSLSFSFDAPVDGAATEKVSALFNYVFYVPLFFTGPLVTYGEFATTARCSPMKIGRLLSRVLRLIFVVVLYEALTHLCYPFSLRSLLPMVDETDLLRKRMPPIDRWVVGGVGYLLGQLLHLRYIILFGVPSLLTSVDAMSNIELDRRPICIAWVHRYSLIWRHFDAGLYTFLHRYVYTPLHEYCESSVCLDFAPSLACFGFIYAFHTTTLFLPHLLLWVAVNFICLLGERYTIRYCRLSLTQSDHASDFWLTPLLMLLLAAQTLASFFFLGDDWHFGSLVVRTFCTLELFPFVGLATIFFLVVRIGHYLERRVPYIPHWCRRPFKRVL